MKKQKKSGVLYTLFLVLLLIVVSLTGTSEAGVQLVPRVNASGQILHGIANEDYVVFGKFDHRKMTYDGAKEGSPTPIIWRVMSADAASGSQTKAILLSHYLLDAMAYLDSSKIVDNGVSANPRYTRPDGGSANKWDGSDVQTWLNGTFLTGFSGNEQASMLLYPDGTNNGAGSKVTLPSFGTNNPGVNWWEWIYTGEMKDWFGSNDVAENAGSYIYGPNSLARRAHFKGASFNYGSADFGWYYWPRSPASDSD